MNSISTWADAWLVAFNTGNTLSVIFSRKLRRPHHPPLLMNYIMLTETDTHRHLGLTLSTTCTWSEHIQTITTKAWARLNLLSTLKFRVSRKYLEKMYISFVRPLLEYCDSVWDNATTESKKQLDTFHIEVARIITGATKLCSISLLLSDLGWESLQDRRNKHKLIIFYKIVHGLTPTYLTDILPPLIQEATDYNLRNANDFCTLQATDYNLRNANDFCTLHANTNLYFNSFFPSTIRAWNSLSEETKQAPAVASCKHSLNRDLNKPPIYFNAGTPKGQILHIRLRLECSSLNSHLYRKKLVPEPSCQCGAFASSYYYLFVCPRYTNVRERYLPENLNNYTTRDLLQGVQTNTVQENETLLENLLKFIIKTGRFER